MRLFDFLYNVYFLLPSFYGFGIVGKMWRHGLTDSFKFFLTRFYKNKIRNSNNYLSLDPNNIQYEKPIIISLTTYSGRIDVVDIAVKCILRQTVKPNRIVIWIAEDEFTENTIPSRVKDLQQFGVEIRYCDNLLAHKKYFYALQEFANSYVITFDDDFFFEKHMLENVMNLKRQFPDCIITNRAHFIKFEKGKLLPYRRWRHNTTQTTPGHQIFATGGVGTVYEPEFFKDYIFNKELIQDLSPRADDVWLKFMAYLNGIKVVTNNKYNKDFVTLPESQKEQLIQSNVQAGGNDSQIRNVINYFKINEQEFMDVMKS